MNKLLISGVIIFATVSFLIVKFPHTLINPGELTNGHQKLNNDCLSCHSPFRGVPNTKCIACHNIDSIGLVKDSIDVQFSKSINFHKLIPKQNCVSCHSDHKGIDTTQTIVFEHTLLDKTTIQNCLSCHARQEDKLHSVLSTSCSSCHNFENWKTVSSFDHNLINKSASQNCISCHQKPKDKLHAAINENCLTCHSITQWKPATFEHSSYFVLDQDHNADCIICHKNSNFDTYTCYGCHEHTPANIASEHREEGITDFNNCVRCHKSADEDNIRREGRSNKKDDDD
jgi:hypothetical protein